MYPFERKGWLGSDPMRVSTSLLLLPILSIQGSVLICQDRSTNRSSLRRLLEDVPDLSSANRSRSLDIKRFIALIQIVLYGCLLVFISHARKRKHGMPPGPRWHWRRTSKAAATTSALQEEDIHAILSAIAHLVNDRSI